MARARYSQAMSQENVEIVRRLYAGVTARSKTPQEPLSRDYVVDASDIAPESSWPRGFEAAEELLREYWETFEDFRIEVEEVIHADDKQVVTAVRDGGRIRGSEGEVTNRFFHVWTFGGGKVIRLSIHTDRTRALEVAGLVK